MLQLLALPAVQIALSTLAIAVTNAVLDEQCEIKNQNRRQNQQNQDRPNRNNPNSTSYNDFDD